MASTNKTTHYDLPQWIGTDKPTFLGDLNGAFSTIDTQLYTAVTNAENANNNATSAAGAVGDMQDDVNDLKTWQTTASSAISGLQNSVSGLTPVISSAAALYVGLGQFLTGYSPVLDESTVMERLITIGNLRMLNIYGNIGINLTGDPTIEFICNGVPDIQLNNIFNKYAIATTRKLHSVANMMLRTSEGIQVIPLTLGSDGSATKLYVAIQGTGTLETSAEIYIDFQALLVLN